MTVEDPLVKQFYTKRGARFGYLERLDISQIVDPQNWSGLELSLTLCDATTTERDRLTVRFSGVRDLTISTIEGLLFYLIEIRSVRERGMEGINYQVSESEYGLISFFCQNFEVS